MFFDASHHALTNPVSNMGELRLGNYTTKVNFYNIAKSRFPADTTKIEYIPSQRIQNRTMLDWTWGTEVTESWGGFISYMHSLPHGSYYNLSMSSSD